MSLNRRRSIFFFSRNNMDIRLKTKVFEQCVLPVNAYYLQICQQKNNNKIYQHHFHYFTINYERSPSEKFRDRKKLNWKLLGSTTFLIQYYLCILLCIIKIRISDWISVKSRKTSSFIQKLKDFWDIIPRSCSSTFVAPFDQKPNQRLSSIQAFTIYIYNIHVHFIGSSAIRTVDNFVVYLTSLLHFLAPCYKIKTVVKTSSKCYQNRVPQVSNIYVLYICLTRLAKLGT